jgi:hypothetical protein
MQYNAPYGVSDPNAPYINGNPSTGTMGSIPPAASIEYPQREIVNLITDAAMVPANGDLHQLAKAVQSGKLIYADDTGTVNILGLNCVPAVAALQKGMVFITEAAATNTGATVANVNGLTAPVVHASDRSTLLPFDINKGQMIALAFDGANFQLVWSASLPSGGSGGPSVGGGALQANYTIYVDHNLGSDTLYDGTTATVDAPHGHGPFATIQKGINTASKLNANGYTITIKIADYGAYANQRHQRRSGDQGQQRKSAGLRDKLVEHWRCRCARRRRRFFDRWPPDLQQQRIWTNRAGRWLDHLPEYRF